MSNTKTATKPTDTSNGTSSGEAEDKAAAQAAQQAEAQGTARTVDFGGHDPETGKPETFTYEVLDGQPSPRAFTYLARYAVDDEGLAFISAMIEILGPDQWADWCDRHESKQMMDFFYALQKVASAGN